MTSLPTHPNTASTISPFTPTWRTGPFPQNATAGLNAAHTGPGAAPGPIIHETPLRDKKGESAAVTVNDLSGRHEAAIADAGAIHPEVALANFFKYLLPLRKCFEEHDVVKTVVERLKTGEKPLLKVDTKLKKFVFHDILSKQAAKSIEKKLFTTLEDIARRIEEIVGELATDIGEKLEPVVKYKDAPGAAPASFNRTSKHIPDGYFILCDRQEDGPADHWIDIGVVGEFKRGEDRKATNKDVRQVVWDMHHMMQEDERRRFTFGFTIEKNSMRLWYVSRSDIYVSENFNFVSSPEHLVHFFLAATYAYEYRLGWDPTMKYVAATETEERHLLITGRSADAPHSTMLFKTVNLLSDVGTEAIRGRGTRVWIVEAVSKDGKPYGYAFPQTYVLKDCWIDSDREREGAILQQVRKSAESLGENGRNILLDALLTVVMYGDVWIDTQDAPDVEEGFCDSTFTAEQRALIHPPGKDSTFIRLQRPAIDDATEDQITTIQSQARGNTHSVHEQATKESVLKFVTHDPKTHSRIAFVEVCKPIQEERQLPRVYLALSNTCYILKALHASGWLHRDISGGNIMLWQNQVKIADFEYAKRFTEMKTAEQLKDIPHHNIRAGTPLYTSVEVDMQEFLFEPDPEPLTKGSSRTAQPKGPDQDRYLSVPIIGASRLRTFPIEPHPTPAKPKAVWQYNPLHDTESLSWLAKELTLNRDLYFIIAEYPKVEVYAPGAGELERLRRQAEAALTLRPKQDTRMVNLTTAKVLANHLETLHPMLRSCEDNPTSRSVAQAIEEVRHSLIATYKIAEQDPMKITNSVAQDLCETMAESYFQAACSLMMVNHIPCIRPLAPELYSLGKQDSLIKDINERPPPAMKTQRAKRTSAKPTPSTSTSGTTGAAAKRKRGESEAEAPKPTTPAEPMDIDEGQCPSSPTDDAQARKRLKETI